MKKNMKRISALALSVVTLTSLASCGGSLGGTRADGLDKSKTGFYVGNFDGGFGDDWLKAAITRFEEAYKDWKNPVNGKTGVDIEISPIRTGGSALIPSANKGVEDIYFTEWVYYYDLVASGNALDISDIVTETNSDGKTIESKFTDDQKVFFNAGTDSEKQYYALPHYSTLHGFYYNEDVFNDYSLFFKGDKDNGYKALEDEEGYVYTNLDGTLSAGPNGIHGDYDDGLPATYEQFFALLDKMVIKSVIPFIWSGQYITGYISWYLEELLFANSGVEQSKAYFNYEGSVSDLITEFNLDEPVISGDEVQITMENGYKLYTTKARYDTLRLFHKIFTNSDYYDSRVNSGTHSHTTAQSDFLQSYYKKDSSKPIAILMEGGYWYNESREFGTIDYLKNYGVSEEDINVKYMPWPKATDEEIGSQTAVATSLQSLGFIRSGVSEENKEICKKFLQFLYPNEHEIINRGISGNRIVDLYARVKKDVWNLKPDVLSILIGINDVWHELYGENGVDLERWERTYRMLIEDTKKRLPDVKIIICEPFVLKGAATEEKYEEFLAVKEYAKKAKEIADDYGLYFLPLQEKFDELSKKYGVKNYLMDGVHPNVAGAKTIADEWLKLFETIR